MGQDQVSRRVSVLMFYENLPKFGNKVKIGNKVQFGNRFTNWCNVWSVVGGGAPPMAMSQNVL